jgi:antitoxin MazE
MHVESEIKKWGNSLALRITGAMADVPHLMVGTKVDVEVTEEALIIKPITHRKVRLRLPYTEDELLATLTPELAHADELANPSGLEFGE